MRPAAEVAYCNGAAFGDRSFRNSESLTLESECVRSARPCECPVAKGLFDRPLQEVPDPLLLVTPILGASTRTSCDVPDSKRGT